MEQLIGDHGTLGTIRPRPLGRPSNSLLARLKPQRRTLSRASYIAKEGLSSSRCALLIEGLAQRNKVVAKGARQILGLCVPGDLVDLPSLFLDRIDHSIQALTPCAILMVERSALRELALEDPRIARQLWVRSMIDVAISREWQANIGRRNAATRMAHLICELRYRLVPGDPIDGECFTMPLTQAHLADVLGLTAVHVNRVLRELEERELIRRDKREIAIPDWVTLRRAADFNPVYLHRDVIAGQSPDWLFDMAERPAR